MQKGHSRGTAGMLSMVGVVLAAGLVVAPARAQNSPFEGVNKRFESTAPQIGEPLARRSDLRPGRNEALDTGPGPGAVHGAGPGLSDLRTLPA
jgi:hypothetical protein